ncbi:type 1 fimbrial major subunit FimA [Kosakonia cowanii]|uniref:type 1 fimbrial major subunit FimA n=1 Tax=Kosakonia cowanii TaxID=208223 RepID=UPI00034A7978|nr:type 1 fimbrial major subunit FimA [Kosakonia cowanii]MDT3411199.1 major type 1 subunit fimbrin (pilin) [Atlantibacter sp. SORGH_AS_0304]
MNTRPIVISLAASMMLLSGVAQARGPVVIPGGNIHFEGELVQLACAISVQSNTQTVAMGQYHTTLFSNVGDTTPLVPFTLTVNDCDRSVATQASVAFAGKADDVDPTLLALTAGDSGGAKGVAIEILDGNSQKLKPDGATYSVAQNLATGSNTLRFAARYKATSAQVTPGSANADTIFIMKYE